MLDATALPPLLLEEGPVSSRPILGASFFEDVEEDEEEEENFCFIDFSTAMEMDWITCGTSKNRSEAKLTLALLREDPTAVGAQFLAETVIQVPPEDVARHCLSLIQVWRSMRNWADQTGMTTQYACYLLMSISMRRTVWR